MMQSIIGLMNSGKTLYMTKKLLKDYKNGRTIFTNYFIECPHYKINRDFLFKLSQIELPNEFKKNKISMGFDELWIWLDSRKSQENTVATWFFNQTSKEDMNIYYTAQNNKQNDSRLRKNTHILSTCERVLKKYDKNKNRWYYDKISDARRILTLEEQKILYIHIINLKMGLFDFEYENDEYIKASNYFNKYNTREVIKRVI